MCEDGGNAGMDAVNMLGWPARSRSCVVNFCGCWAAEYTTHMCSICSLDSSKRKLLQARCSMPAGCWVCLPAYRLPGRGCCARLATSYCLRHLVQACERPDVVEIWDVTAMDPKLLVYLKVGEHVPCGTHSSADCRNDCMFNCCWGSACAHKASHAAQLTWMVQLPAVIKLCGLGGCMLAYLLVHTTHRVPQVRLRLAAPSAALACGPPSACTHAQTLWKPPSRLHCRRTATLCPCRGIGPRSASTCRASAAWRSRPSSCQNSSRQPALVCAQGGDQPTGAVVMAVQRPLCCSK